MSEDDDFVRREYFAFASVAETTPADAAKHNANVRAVPYVLLVAAEHRRIRAEDDIVLVNARTVAPIEQVAAGPNDGDACFRGDKVLGKQAEPLHTRPIEPPAVRVQHWTESAASRLCSVVRHGRRGRNGGKALIG